MQLGFVSAIVPELSLEAVLSLAAKTGYACVEVMCWPPGKAERRYAGVTHIDVTAFDAAAADGVRDLVARTGVQISALGYYPNPLAPDPAERQVYSTHLRAVIDAAQLLGVTTINTFIGRDPRRSIDDNWPLFLEVWPPLVRYAAERGINIGIENCPMLFTDDEWPGGKNLAIAPSIWRRMFAAVPDAHFGLNYDPSHLIWQQMDEVAPIAEFAPRFHHVHAKDARVDRRKLDQVGILATPLSYHTPKLPGLGDVRWGAFFAALSDAGYRGPVCVEVEDRAYEGSLADRERALRQCALFLRQFIGG
ncbi:MAG TPA: sugar phosphate isomerase/epimerase [Chloroflexota bacterium]|jgi:sugar phosphate isomerase/epimerase|nr:sugar phosphate isomerase/epimerase [Chloroflexota bacterium]